MKLDALRNLIHTTPGPTGPEIDAQARAWLEASGLHVEPGEGAPVVLVVVAVDHDADFHAYAVPATSLDATAHDDLAKVSGAAFEFHFTADLRPDQFAGAFRICGCRSEEPDVFQDQIEDLREEVEEEGVEIDFESLIDGVGAWLPHRLSSGARLSGPITHVYSATLCM